MDLPRPDPDAAYHAHVYYDESTRGAAAALHSRLLGDSHAAGRPRVLFLGALRDRPVGPHPMPQFEVHFLAADMDRVVPMLEASGLRVLVHPLTDDDLADHTSLARWIGAPLALDLSVLDPPGANQGVARFGKSDV